MKRQPKFKVGDKVKVLRASTNAEHDLWGDTWMSEMNYSIGCVFTIKHVGNYYDFEIYYEYSKYLLSTNDGMSYPEFVLQKVCTKGEQLLFNFME